jgi:hypothetical protein
VYNLQRLKRDRSVEDRAPAQEHRPRKASPVEPPSRDIRSGSEEGEIEEEE